MSLSAIATTWPAKVTASNCGTYRYINQQIIIQPSDDAVIQLSVTKNDWDIKLYISYNENGGSNGVAKIYNASNELVNQVDVNLVSSPGYHQVALPEWAAGTYMIVLTTSTGVHTSHFTIP